MLHIQAGWEKVGTALEPPLHPQALDQLGFMAMVGGKEEGEKEKEKVGNMWLSLEGKEGQMEDYYPLEKLKKSPPMMLWQCSPPVLVYVWECKWQCVVPSEAQIAAPALLS